MKDGGVAKAPTPKDESSRGSSRPTSMDLDELGPLEIVQRAVGGKENRDSPKCHSRSSSHDSYFERRLHFKVEDEEEDILTPDGGGKTESALDLSEIQVRRVS